MTTPSDFDDTPVDAPDPENVRRVARLLREAAASALVAITFRPTSTWSRTFPVMAGRITDVHEDAGQFTVTLPAGNGCLIAIRDIAAIGVLSPVD